MKNIKGDINSTYIFNKMSNDQLNHVDKIDRICFDYNDFKDINKSDKYGDAYVLVHNKSNTIVGYLVIYEDNKNGSSYIYRIGVLPFLRNFGLANFMIESTINRLRLNMNIKYICCDVRESNSVSIDFFKSLDFKVIEHRYDIYEDGEISLFMRKLINQ